MRVLAKSFRKITAISFVLTLLISSFVLAQDVNFRVMTYNGLKLDGTDTDRQSAFQTVLQAANPDVLLMQEIVDAAGADLILTALNAGGNQYSRATFINGVDTDNMLFYRTSIGTLTSQNEIPTALREFSEYVMQIGDNEIRFYSAHLKASSGSTNEQKRLDEVTVLRNHLNNLPAGTEFVVVGDFNMYDSNEPAYQKFIANEADNDGRAEDPLAFSGGVGDWHINPAFANVHTQSPRTTQFGGGAHGGLDDRFDFILTSFGINDNSKVDMIPGTYTAFGNDGNHFDTSLLDGPNSAVSATVAQAIHDASDHLPVYADFVSLSNGGSAGNDVLFSEIFYDTPGTDSQEEWVELYNASASPIDISGWVITDNNGTGSSFTLPGSSIIQAGTYLTVARNASGFNTLYGFDADVSGSLPALNNGGDALLLKDDLGTLIDEVAWEGGASSGTPSGWGSSSNPSAPTGSSIERTSLTDTDSFSDWSVVNGNGNPETQATQPPSAGVIVISEVLYDTPGTDSDEEWIELFNAGGSTVDISGWTITDNNGTGSTYTYSNGVSLAAGTFYTVATDQSGFNSLYGKSPDDSGSIPALNNGGDTIILKDGLGSTVDEVAWEGGASSGTPSGWGSSSNPSASTGSSIVRSDLFVDTDAYSDWITASGNGNPNTQSDGAVSSEALPEGEELFTEELPTEVTLGNYPNPFNPTTNIHFTLTESNNVRLTVFNMIGQEVAVLVNGFKNAGKHDVTFNATNLSTGVYIYRLVSGGQVKVQKMLLTK